MERKIKFLGLSSMSLMAMLHMRDQKTSYNMTHRFLAPLASAQALVRDNDELKRLRKLNTNAYVYGEGFQVDPSQDYSNFTPKKIQQFKGLEKPNVIDMAFGWYHEAYIEQNGKLYVCAKAKLSSIEVEGVRDGDRQDLTEVTSLPKGTKVQQVAFTQTRMFVLSDKGDVYTYKIQEHFPTREEMMFASMTPNGKHQIRGELMVNDPPMKIKELKNLKQVACGIDHVLFLDKSGDLYAMGDDTFGQCGAGVEGRVMTAPFNEARQKMPRKV